MFNDAKLLKQKMLPSNLPEQESQQNNYQSEYDGFMNKHDKNIYVAFGKTFMPPQ